MHARMNWNGILNCDFILQLLVLVVNTTGPHTYTLYTYPERQTHYDEMSYVLYMYYAEQDRNSTLLESVNNVLRSIELRSLYSVRHFQKNSYFLRGEW